MLAYEFKLTATRDFQRVRDLGTSLQSRNFLFTYFRRKVDIDSPSRFGFVVTTKTAPRAVDRNRAKRVLNEAVRQQLTYVLPGYDCVFLIRESILRAYTADVFKEVGNIFEKANVTQNLQK